MSAKILVIDIERQSALLDEVWEGRQYDRWIGPNRVIEPSRTVCFAYRWLSEKRTGFVAEWEWDLPQDNTSPTPGGGHEQMILAGRDLMCEADYIVGWNSKHFDVKHLNAGFYAYGLMPPSPHIDIDLMLQSANKMALPAKSMAYVAKLRGMQGKLKNEPMLRRKLRYADGDVLLRAQRAYKRYNKRDVDQTVELYYDMLPWLSGMNLGLFEDDKDGILCSNCGSDHVTYQGLRANATFMYRRFQCQDCFKWGRDRKSFKSTMSVGI